MTSAMQERRSPTPAATYIDDSAYRALRNDFDLVAPVYDNLAALVFGGAIRRAQLELLPELGDARSALILGGGTGWFLLELLGRSAVERVLYIEKSKAMLDRSRELISARAPHWLSRVDFRLGTEDSLTEADGPVDLVVTNFYLDLFNNLNCAGIIERLEGLLSPAGRWLFVDFHTPELGWERLAAKALFKLMYAFFVVTSRIEARKPPHYEPTFHRLGLRIASEQTFYRTMIRARVLERQSVSASMIDD